MKKERAFPGTFEKYRALIESIRNQGFDGSRGAVPGYELVHPKWGSVFIYTDGNQRMGVLSHLSAKSRPEEMMVPVEVRQTIMRDRLLDYPLTQQLVQEGYFSEQDVFRWFDNAFWFVAGC